jgi:hypothetical protein
VIPTPNPPITFVHIPKAAGTTLRKTAERLYPNRTLYIRPVPWPEQLDAVRTEAVPGEVDFISGHFPIDLVDHLPFRTRIISVLRDPVARVVSQYHYVLRSPEHHQHAQAVAMTLEEYALSDLGADLDNVQTRMLAGFDPGYSTPINALTRDVLDLARESIERRLWLVGVQEHMDAFMSTLAHRLGWPSDLEVTSYLVAPERPEIDDRVARMIRERNWMDAELHARAAAIFEACIGSSGGAEAA